MSYVMEKKLIGHTLKAINLYEKMDFANGAPKTGNTCLNENTLYSSSALQDQIYFLFGCCASIAYSRENCVIIGW